MTTKQVGTVHTIFGIDSVQDALNAMAGEHADDFDMEAAAGGYRDYLTDYLPGTLVVVGDDVMMQTDDPFATRLDQVGIEQIRDDMSDAMASGDVFDLAPYAKDACTQCGAAGRGVDSHTCDSAPNTHTEGDDLRARHTQQCQDSGLWLLCQLDDGVCDLQATASADVWATARKAMGIGMNFTGAARTLAASATADGYETAVLRATAAHRSFAAAGALYDVGGYVKARSEAEQRMEIAQKAMRAYGEMAKQARELDRLWGMWEQAAESVKA